MNLVSLDKANDIVNSKKKEKKNIKQNKRG